LTWARPRETISAMTLGAGSILRDNIRLECPLGEGAIGTLWRAHHQGLGCSVAVKVLRPERVTDVARLRLEQEAWGMAQLDHPHIARVFDFGFSEDGDAFMVMELLRGEDLRNLLERRGKLEIGEVAVIVSQVAKALSRAHGLGVVHRDIKPANLFVVDMDGEPFVKVLDFGVAKFAAITGFDMTRTGAHLGTPYYMSPEQHLDSKYVDLQADLWALAVTAYLSLAGAPPYRGDTVVRYALEVCTKAPIPLRSFRPDLSVSVEAWFTRALSRKADARFSSARDMADALRRCVADG
jgi:serine/threonine-protein kinase